MLTDLVVKFSAAIAEIVRAGIQSVDRGQWEASKELGLHSGQIMRLIVLPQAPRVITPLTTSNTSTPPRIPALPSPSANGHG